MFDTASAASTLVPDAQRNDPDYRARFEQLYQQLRAIAHRELSGRRSRATLCTTVLVHETYLKLAGNTVDASDRGPFLALAAKVMRCVLVDYVRSVAAQKRGGDQVRVTLVTDLPLAAEGDRIDLLSIEQGLAALQQLDPRLATMVEYRFYGGMEFAEIGAQLGVTERTVHRDWRKARAFLLAHLGDAVP
ncbi:ECF-type sigma factor [Luteimonas aquatica]|uniref:ECF-type sigma factor n=1 Tax=Luteimonas aquatica TaxID=450364 RepID=UPI001F55F3B9|nr:ECF-type sigma factor [Luteimonas aquatica]